MQTAVEYGAAHGALAMTTPSDTTMVAKAEVLKLGCDGGARVDRRADGDGAHPKDGTGAVAGQADHHRDQHSLLGTKSVRRPPTCIRNRVHCHAVGHAAEAPEVLAGPVGR